MNILLMITLLQPKYGKKVTNLAMAGILIANLIVSLYGYIAGNLTLLARLDLIAFTFLCFIIRPLFKENFMQWLFSYITVQNIVMCVIVLSFSLSRGLTYPIYANTLIRLLLFGGIIFVIRRFVRPLYSRMVTYWTLFFFMAVSIFAAFVYYFTIGEDIIRTLTEQSIQIHLLVLITVVVYVSIFHSIETISREYALREENLQMQNNQEFLHLSSRAMENRIMLLNDAHKQSSITAHDHRHLNNTLLELLERENLEDAIACLRQQSSVAPTLVKNYCENIVVNAAVSYYTDFAKEEGLKTDINLEIPNDFEGDSIELAIVISNLFENAIHACAELKAESEEEQELMIKFTCRHVGRLVIEISNPCGLSVILDENGYPTSKVSGHGIGTKSVLAFAQKYNAEVFFQVLEGVFRVRMLI